MTFPVQPTAAPPRGVRILTTAESSSVALTGIVFGTVNTEGEPTGSPAGAAVSLSIIRFRIT